MNRKDKAEIIKFAKAAKIIPADSKDFDHMSGDFMLFVEMVYDHAYSAGYSEGYVDCQDLENV